MVFQSRLASLKVAGKYINFRLLVCCCWATRYLRNGNGRFPPCAKINLLTRHLNLTPTLLKIFANSLDVCVYVYVYSRLHLRLNMRVLRVRVRACVAHTRKLHFASGKVRIRNHIGGIRRYTYTCTYSTCACACACTSCV